MAISVGDNIPAATLRVKGEEGIDALSTDDIFAGKKVAIFGVPGAFTPT
jgi:peroxiredoxin